MPVSPPAGQPAGMTPAQREQAWAKPDPVVLTPPGSVTVSEVAVQYAVLWALQSRDQSTIVQVARMLQECHGRLTEPMHFRLRNLLAHTLEAVGKDDPLYPPFDRALGKMIDLSMKRSSR